MSLNQLTTQAHKIKSGITSAPLAYDMQTDMFNAMHRPDEFDSSCLYSIAWREGEERDQTIQRVITILEEQQRLFANGQTIFVSADMCAEISEASSTMVDSVIIEQDVFTPSGVMFLEEPYVFTHPEPQSGCSEVWLVKALGYYRYEDGINVFLYGNLLGINDPSTDDSFMFTENSLTIFSENTDVERAHAALLEKIKGSSDYIELLQGLTGGKMRVFDATHFKFGETPTQYDPSILVIKKFILAFFRLTHDYLDADYTKPPRSMMRRAERAHRPSDGYIVTMKLRRRMTRDNDGTHASPSYAFRVRGHWKRQYMPSRKLPKGNPAAYRHVYIKDYIKGRGEFVDSHRVVKVAE